MKEKCCRGAFYVVGMLLLALGITLNTKTNMGVSPIISVAYSASIFLDKNVGDMTLIWYLLFVAVQIGCHIYLKKYKVIVTDILQIPLSIVFTRFMNLFSGMIPTMTGNIAVRVLWLCLAIVLTGVGMSMSLNERLIPNPGDGIVQAISDCCGKKVGTVKNILDSVCVILTLVFSAVCKIHILGVGIGFGTIMAVIFVGRVVAVFNHFCRDRMLILSGLQP